MAIWPDLLRTKRARFKERVQRELEFYIAAHGEGALSRLQAELQRPELRSRYREVLQAAIDELAAQTQARPKAAGGGMGETLRRMTPRKTRSSAG